MISWSQSSSDLAKSAMSVSVTAPAPTMYGTPAANRIATTCSFAGRRWVSPQLEQANSYSPSICDVPSSSIRPSALISTVPQPAHVVLKVVIPIPIRIVTQLSDLNTGLFENHFA